MQQFLVTCLGWGLMALAITFLDMAGDNPSEGVALLIVGLLFSGGLIVWYVSPIGRMILKGILFVAVVLVGSTLWDNRKK